MPSEVNGYDVNDPGLAIRTLKQQLRHRRKRLAGRQTPAPTTLRGPTVNTITTTAELGDKPLERCFPMSDASLERRTPWRKPPKTNEKQPHSIGRSQANVSVRGPHRGPLNDK